MRRKIPPVKTHQIADAEGGACGGRGRGLYFALNILYYIMLVALVGFLILPHTSAFYRVRLFLPFTLHLNKHELVLVSGENERIYVNGINKRAVFTSMDFKVAGVTINGTVKARKPGKTFIKVKVDNRVFKCRVYVIRLNKTSLTLQEGKTFRLKVSGYGGSVSFKSSNSQVVKVNRYGKVTAVRKGSTTVKAVVRGKSVSCRIRVT